MQDVGINVCAQWLLLRVLLRDKHLTFQEVDNRSYTPPEEQQSQLISGLSDARDLLPVLREHYEFQEKRRHTLQDKVKNLLTISAILLPLCVSIAPRLNGAAWIVPPLFLFLITIYILFISFGVDRQSIPLIPEKAFKEGKHFEAEWAASIHRSSHNNQYAIDFVVDVYKAARITFGLGLVAFVAVAVVALWSPSQQGPPKLQQDPNSPLRVAVTTAPSQVPIAVHPTITMPPVNVMPPVVNATMVFTQPANGSPTTQPATNDPHPAKGQRAPSHSASTSQSSAATP